MTEFKNIQVEAFWSNFSKNSNNRRIDLLNKENKTPEEKKEYLKLHRLEKFSYSTVNLLEKTDKKDINTKFVNMWEWKIIEFDKSNEQPKNIFTIWLWWCTATAINIELINWTNKVLLTHFPPVSKTANINKIEELIRENIDLSKVKEVNYIIVTAEKYKKNKSWKYDTTYDKSFTDLIEKKIESILGNKVKWCIRKYNTSKVNWVKDQWVFSLSLRKDWVTYKEWAYWFWMLNWDN